MYVPEHFQETHRERMQTLMRDHPFGLLVSGIGDPPFVSHLPLFYEPFPEPWGRVLGHMARANPQWQSWTRSENPVLAIFQGPDAYISPSWYATPDVPTWNYAVVHVSGSVRLITEEDLLVAMLDQLTDRLESSRPVAWKPDWEDARLRKLIAGIVGFEIRITEIRAQFKLGQNRSLEDQRRVREQLLRSGRSDAAELARLMPIPDPAGSGSV
ncbi:MAG: FMN-binding negative transcriptional regulator [Gammaproteobacteria bacterium]